MPDTSTAGAQSAPGVEDVQLPITIRLADGRVYDSALGPERHRALHLGMLHARSRGYVELAAGRRSAEGKLALYTRRRSDHFLPAGLEDARWLEPLLELAEAHQRRGDEVFIGPAPRVKASASKADVHFSEWVWLDIDGAQHLSAAELLLARKPAHLQIESAGSGGQHLYWRLSRPLPARTIALEDGRVIVNPQEVREATGRSGRTRLVGYRDPSGAIVSQCSVTEWIERANLRLAHALGHAFSDGRVVSVADTQCRDRSRAMRLAGTVNGKSRRHARIVRADLRLPAYDPQSLLGDLRDPPGSRPRRRRGLTRLSSDPYRAITAAEYFLTLAATELPARGNVSCPTPSHQDREPSCSVDEHVWYCHGCGAGGSIYDLASALGGGPTGDALAASPEHFRAAKQRVVELFGKR